MFGTFETNEQPDTAIPNPQSDGAQMVDQAGGEAVDAHKNLLGEAVNLLGGQGMDLGQLAQMAGIHTADVSALSSGDLVQLTQYLALHHPEILQMLAQQFPQAQGLLGLLTGGVPATAGEGASAPGGGILGGLLGRVLGGL